MTHLLAVRSSTTIGELLAGGVNVIMPIDYQFGGLPFAIC